MLSHLRTRALLLLPLYFFLTTFSQRALSNAIAFEQPTAIHQWLGITGSQPHSVYYASSLQSGVAIALSRIFARGTTWKLVKTVSYGYGGAFPTPHEEVQVSQKPYRLERLPVDGMNFIEKVGQPDVRLVVGNYETAAAIYYDWKKSSDAANAFHQELKEEVEARSVYRAGILEFKETGLVGFLAAVESYQLTWDAVILPSDLKDEIRGTIEGFLKAYDLQKFTTLGLPLNRGVLLYGPPGTGKSVIGKILISQVLQQAYGKPVTYLHVVARHVARKHSIKGIYDTARLFSPAVVFIEDVDLIAGTDRQDKIEAKNELMQQLSGIEELKGILTIATTNYGDKIDEALKRSKRLGFHYLIGVPSAAERVELLRLFTKDLVASHLDLAAYSQQMEGMTGADLREIVRLAVENAVRAHSLSAEKKIVLKDEHVRSALEFRKRTKVSPVSGG